MNLDIGSVARYQEANPAVYTVITFPFLFAVMFGDWGHGICLLLGALVLIARESKLSKQVYHRSWAITKVIIETGVIENPYWACEHTYICLYVWSIFD